MSNLLKIRAAATAPPSLRTVGNRAGHHLSKSVHCNECCVQRLCLAANTPAGELTELGALIDHWHPMSKERYIVREGDAFNAVFLVRSGSVKTSQALANGEEKITGFYFPGEIFGLDGLAGNQYLNTAMAMETTSLCALSMQRLLAHPVDARGLEQRFLFLLSELLNRKDEHSVMLSRNKAHERIAAFLLDLSRRFERRHLSAVCFSLPMSRTDVSHYLGLSLESVSRAFAKLEKDRVVKSNGRMIEIMNLYALESLAGVIQPQQRQLA